MKTSNAVAYGRALCTIFLSILVSGCEGAKPASVVYNRQTDEKDATAVPLGSHALVKVLDQIPLSEAVAMAIPGEIMSVTGTFVLSEKLPNPPVICEINRRLASGEIVTANSAFKETSRTKEGAKYNVIIKAPKEAGEYEIVVVADGHFAGRGTLVVKAK